MLINAGLIDDMQLSAALSHQRQWGGKLGEVLVEKGFVDEMILWRGLSKQLGMELVSLPATAVTPELIQVVPRELVEKFDVFPVRYAERHLTIATDDPNQLDAVDEIAFRTGLRVSAALAPPREILWAIRRYYYGDMSPCPAPKSRQPLATEEFKLVDRTGATLIKSIDQIRAEHEAHSVAVQDPASDAALHTELASLKARMDRSTAVLKVIVSSCIAQGVFTRDEYLAKLKSLG